MSNPVTVSSEIDTFMQSASGLAARNTLNVGVPSEFDLTKLPSVVHGTLLYNGYIYAVSPSGATSLIRINPNDFTDITIGASIGSLGCPQLCQAGGFIYGITNQSPARVYKFDPNTLVGTLLFTTSAVANPVYPTICTDGTNLFCMGGVVVEKWVIATATIATSRNFGGSYRWHSCMVQSGLLWITDYGRNYAALSLTDLSGSVVVLTLTGNWHVSITDDITSDGTYMYFPSETKNVDGVTGTIVRVPIAAPSTYVFIQASQPVYGIYYDPATTLIWVGYNANQPYAFLQYSSMTSGATNTFTNYTCGQAQGALNELFVINGTVYGSIWNTNATYSGCFIRSRPSLFNPNAITSFNAASIALNANLDGTGTIDAHYAVNAIAVQSTPSVLSATASVGGLYQTYTVQLANPSGSGSVTVTADSSIFGFPDGGITLLDGNAIILVFFYDPLYTRTVLVSQSSQYVFGD